jgi:hypothetical protein
VLVGIGLQPRPQGGGPTPNRQPTGQYASLPGATLDAALHHRPHPQQARPDLCLVTPGHFVGEHQFADAQTSFGGQHQQFVGSAERKRNVAELRSLVQSANVVLVEDCSAADGIAFPLQHRRTVVAQRREHHAVAVERQSLPSKQDDVGGSREHDPTHTAQAQFARFGDGGGPRSNVIGVDGLGVLPLQPEHQCGDGAMPDTRRPERAEELDTQPGRPLEQVLVGQQRHEGLRRAHGPDGVRTRRSDPDLEEVEHAAGHGDARKLSYSGKGCLTGEPFVDC